MQKEHKVRNFLKTSIEYVKHIATTGAVSETSRYVEEEITTFIKPNKKQAILELGGGHGNITKMILSKMHPDSILYVFEIKDEFIPILQRIQDKRLVVIHDSATNLFSYMKPESMDCVISSLPITIIPKEIEQEILLKAHQALSPTGTFHQVLYSIKTKKFNTLYADIHLKPVLNFPLAFVHHCFKGLEVGKGRPGLRD